MSEALNGVAEARLFHYTSLEGWEGIKAEGLINATSYNADHVDLAGGTTRLVWLSDSLDRDSMGLSRDRTRLRISVAPVPAVRYWPIWPATKDSRRWLESRPGVDPASWFVSLEGIPRSAWGEVVDLGNDVTRPHGAPDLPLSAWGPAPSLEDVERAEQTIRAAYDRIQGDFEAGLEITPAIALRAMMRNAGPLTAMVATMKLLLLAADHRCRAGWRTLAEEIDTVNAQLASPTPR